MNGLERSSMTHKTLTLGRKLARLWDKKTESIITPTEHSKIILDKVQPLVYPNDSTSQR